MLKRKGNDPLTKLEQKIAIKNLPLIGNELIVSIINRTQSGKDYNNQQFKPYSKTYAKAKQKEFGTSRVNLTRTQQMLNAITFKSIPKGLRFYFNANEQNNKAYYNQVKNKREFFMISAKDKEIIKAFIAKNIKS